MKAVHDDKITKTNIRIGQYDYLVRTQSNNTNTKWNEIPPLILSDKLPPFNVGIIDKMMDENEDEENDDDEEIRKEMSMHMH